MQSLLKDGRHIKQTRIDDNTSRLFRITHHQILLYLCSSRLENMHNAVVLQPTIFYLFNTFILFIRLVTLNYQSLWLLWICCSCLCGLNVRITRRMTDLTAHFNMLFILVFIMGYWQDQFFSNLLLLFLSFKVFITSPACKHNEKK